MKIKISKSLIHSNKFYLIETAIIVLMASTPLFFNFPYRINIFLSWEGAYRIYNGQIPFKDFGIPMGYTYWLVPALFFKLFGPYLASLIKSQVFINIISGIAFRSILHSFKVKDGIRTLSVIIFCLSYSFFNFWPWYNHSVIVIQLIALSFLFKYIFSDNTKGSITYLYLAGLFTFLTFFTKQDAGGLAFLMALGLLVVSCFYTKKFNPILHFLLAYFISFCLVIIPLLPYDFGYWFNYGQSPHNSRLSLIDFLVMIFGQSDWIKFYLFIIVILIINEFKSTSLIKNKQATIFYLFVIGILLEALLFQVTSYTPPDNNIFFHSFAFALIITKLPLSINFNKVKVILPLIILVFFWWSGTYWKYIKRIADRVVPSLFIKDNNQISMSTYAQSNTSEVDSTAAGMDKWKLSGLKAFDGVYMPTTTIEGIKRLVNDPYVKNKNLRVLNMTELTPLAQVMNYQLEKGTPLWYHVGVGMFETELAFFENRINNDYYDLILFQDIPNLNNFYPNEIYTVLKEKYKLVDSFRAPRRKANSSINIFVKDPSKWQY